MNLTPTTITFGGYILFLIGIGLWYSRQSSHSIADYILGGRQMGPAVTALSACASDMSSYLVMAIPGMAYLYNPNCFWMACGLIIGTWFNWKFVAKRLRVFTQHAQNSLTIPEFLEQRFHDDQGILRLMSAATILLFFTIYVSSGMQAGAIVFENVFGISYTSALLIGTSVIVLYTFLGGFLAVSWTDFFQGMLILCALILVPLIIYRTTPDSNALITSISTEFDLTDVGLLSILSAFGWGIGYMGQPHILSRFMAIKRPQDLPLSGRIAIIWNVFALSGAILTGLGGAAYFIDAPMNNHEYVFIALSQTLFDPWIGGLLLAAILSAIMSTVDSQLLVCSSVVTEDFYKKWWRPHASERELMWMGRFGIVLIAALATWSAYEKNETILSLVSYAWAGFGAALGSVVLLSLFYAQYTRNGAVASMLVGAITVIAWQQGQGGWFELYSIIPGFIAAIGAGILVSRIQSHQLKTVTQVQFQQFLEQLKQV
jgi:sodium/proline symporter